MKNKIGAGLSGGTVVLIVLALVAAYVFNVGGFQDLFVPSEEAEEPVGRCPSSGLTEVTLNTQEALASSATNSNVSYYAFDSGVLVKEGETGSDGTVSFDLECAASKTYKLLILNEKATTGIYPSTHTIDASGSVDVLNLQTYEFGEVGIANLGSSVDPAGTANISAGAGKSCGFTITFTSNESAAAFNKPLIMCLTNTTSVVDVFMTGAGAADAKAPVRISAISGYEYHTFEYAKKVDSTDAAVMLSGKIQFSSSSAPVSTDNMSCIIVDQSTFKKADYKTLSLSQGFVEAAENTETRANVGAADSNRATLNFLASPAYC